MQKRCGGASSYITVSPDDVNNPTSFRLAHCAINNKDFPATVNETFFKSLREAKSFNQGSVKLPCDYTSRIQAASGNPVAVAVEFCALVENVLTILIGCPLNFQPGTNSKNVRSPHHKGMHGHVTAYHGCIETQERSALHFHIIIIWGGITPKLLEHSVPFPSLCKIIGEALDTMHQATLPTNLHIQNMLHSLMKQSKSGRTNFLCQQKNTLSWTWCLLQNHHNNIGKISCGQTF